MGQVFLSFSTQQLDVATRVKESLEARLVPCFLANADIEYGEDIYLAIERELPNSPVLMPLLSAEYLKSGWTKLERSTFKFLEAPEGVRTTIPILLGDFPERDVPPLIKALKHYRLADVDGVERLADELAPRLRELLSDSPALAYDAFAREMGLRELIVVERASGDALYRGLGRGAAGYLEQQALRNFRIGLACANTIYNVVQQVRDDFQIRLNAYPISFHLEPEMDNVLSAYAALIELWKRNPQCKPHSLPLPTFFRSNEEREMLTSRPDVKALLEDLHDLNMAFYSCGALEPGSSFHIHQKYINDYLDPAFATETLTGLGACGEINLCPYSIDGEQIDHPVPRAVEILPLDRIRELARREDRHMVLVAGGRHKVAPVLGALRGGYANVLVIDQGTLDRVIELDRQAQPATA